jgi:hypothetical protein
MTILDNRQYMAAHAALDRWLEDAQAQATSAHAAGCGGHIGTFTLRAEVSLDDEVAISIESVVVTPLGVSS